MFGLARRSTARPATPGTEVIGLCRFSWPGSGGFQIRHDTLEARRAHLYAPDRLADRLRIFEAFTLPSLHAQTDPDFTLIVVIGPDLPTPARARLETMLAGVPQAVLSEQPPGTHRAVMRDVVTAARRRPDAPCAQFRLDDDDAVNRGFVAGLRAAVARFGPAMAGERWWAVDYNRGWQAVPGPAGISAAELQRPYVSAGLGLVFAPGVDKAVLDFAHHRVWQSMPTVTLTDPDMFVRGIDGHNDSDGAEALRRFPVVPLDPDGEARFRTAFGIDADRVRALYADRT